MNAIEVSSLSKVYKVYNKGKGLKGTIEGVFHRSYTDKVAVNDVSFSLMKGEIVGFIGPNGAGKTSTIKMLTGLLYPTSGFVSVLGYAPWKRQDDFKKKITTVFGSRPQLIPELTALDYFELLKSIYEIGDDDFQSNLNDLASLLNCNDLLSVQFRRLSLGEKMKMEFIAATLHQPQILFLDEPTIGLDFISQKKIREFLKAYRDKYNATILITSHDMNDISELCERVIVINQGTVMLDTAIQELYDLYGTATYLNLTLENPIKYYRGNGEIVSEEGNKYSIKIESTLIGEELEMFFKENTIIDITIDRFSLKEILREIYEVV